MSETTIEVDENEWRKRAKPGPWDDEPNRVEWRDEATGLPCLIVRQARTGHLCGYVAVPPGHPLHGSKDDDLDDLDVHGGVTYAAKCAGRVCHVPAPGEPDDVWWLGFDCAHAWDLWPTDEYRWAGDGVYRSVEYVKSECAKLAAQIKAAS